MRAFFYFTLVLVILVGLLAQDVDVDVQMGTEETANYSPLLRFASIGDVDSVKDELRQGRDVNERSEDGVAAVHAAARYSHNEVLRVLIEARADLNVQERDGWTPLMFAAYSGNADAIKLILDNNADPLLHNANNYGAHSLAFFNEFKEAAVYIAEAGLRRAIENADFHNMQVMIQDGAFVNTQTAVGATALMVAAHAGNDEMVAWLLSQPDIRPDFQEHDGWTAIMFAAYFDHANIVRMLLDHGVDLNVANKHGMNVVTLAQANQREQVLRVLQERIALMEAAAAHQQGQGQGQGEERADAQADTAAAQQQQDAPAANAAVPPVQDAGIQAEKKPEPAKAGWKLW